MAWVQSSPKGGIRQGYSIFTTEFLRNSTVRPCRGGSDGSCRPGCHGKKEGFRASDHCPIFLSVGAPAEGRPALLEHPPKRVRQGKSRQARADGRGRRGLARPPSGGLDFIFPAEGRQPLGKM